MAGRKGQRSGGHNAKTTQQHKTDGTYQPVRHAKRVDNKPTEGSPRKPRGLSKVASAFWDETVGHLPDGCVGRGDSMALAEMCRWYELYRECMVLLDENPIDRDARAAATAYWDRVWRIAKDFGVTPVERTRLQDPKGDDDDTEDAKKKAEFQRLAANRGTGNPG